jgi:hypothetical protein
MADTRPPLSKNITVVRPMKEIAKQKIKNTILQAATCDQT